MKFPPAAPYVALVNSPTAELELRACEWHRAYCPKCGLVNEALPDRLEGKRSACPLCESPCVVAYKSHGRTNHDVPFIERVVPLVRRRLCFAKPLA